MKVKYLLTMWCLLILCPFLLAKGAQTLSIDSQLGTSVEDCFERISIGEQLPSSAIYRNVSELTTRECEQICKQDKQCQAYDYGVGAKGNATCNLSNLGEKELKEKSVLERHPDYDVYVRRFQCEQGPPTPLKPQQDEGSPGGNPSHRPIFRPDAEDPKRPLSDDFAPDLRPYETMRPDFGPYPPYKPYRPPHYDRPDDYHNQAPDFDMPPSYGAHRPQDIPYRPTRPYQNQSFDPYDVLQFQDGRPQYPNFRPNPYPYPVNDISGGYGNKPSRPRPDLPPYRPDEPEYVYINSNRPNKKPSRPNDDPIPGYGPVKPLDYLKPGYESQKPIRPVDNPYKPGYNQYASNYGQNQYNDNSIYVEIYDPPRPYKPSKPINDRPYGASGSQSYGQNYGYGSQNFNSQSSYHGAVTEIDNYNRPDPQRPYKPQDSSGTSGYGLQDVKPEKPYSKPSPGYGLSQEPAYKPQKPFYESTTSGYGGGTQFGYQESTGYGSIHKPQDYNKPVAQNPYGGTQDTSNFGSYGAPNRPLYSSQSQQSYGSSFQSYGENRPPYRPLIDERPSYERPPYNRPSSDNRPYPNRPSYGERPDINGPIYGELPSYIKPLEKPQRPYGNRPSDPYGSEPQYGKPEKPTTVPPYQTPAYQKPDVNPGYDNNRPDGELGPEDSGGYKNNKPKLNATEGYNSNKPEIKPVYEYELEKPHGVPSYIVRPGGEVITSRPVTIGDYGRPPYGREPVMSYKGKTFYFNTLTGVVSAFPDVKEARFRQSEF